MVVGGEIGAKDSLKGGGGALRWEAGGIPLGFDGAVERGTVETGTS